jgi:broad specificity phosphatase PhoE
MVEIILVRHGETQWNAAEVFRGRADIALNENGFAQAKLLGEYLKHEDIGAVYSGPLQRAVKTAEALAAPHNLPVNITGSLNDIDCGKWEGLPLTEVKEKYEEDYQDWLDTPEQVRIPGGETLDEVTNRAMPFIWEAIKKTEKGKIVLVSHRAVHKVLVTALLDMDNSAFWSFKLDTAGLTRFTFDGRRFIMTAFNDTSFLKPLNIKPLNDF